MDALTAIMTRRSVRAFSDEPVTDQLMETGLRAAMAAPSASNERPWRFVVVREPENLAPQAQVSATSEYNQDYAARYAVDGRVPDELGHDAEDEGTDDQDDPTAEAESDRELHLTTPSSLNVGTGVLDPHRRAVHGRPVVPTRLIGAAFSHNYLLAMGLFTLAGTAMVLNNVLTNTLLQTSAPDQLRGRVMGVYSFLILGLSPFGSLQAGIVAQHLGVQAAIGSGGAICLLVTGLVAWRMSRTAH